MEKLYLSKNIEKILDKLDDSRLGNKVGIKVHFGEKGSVTYLNPEIVKKICNKVKELGKDVSLVECNVLYRGSRTTREEHIKTAKEHGFDFAPIDILDGEKGERFVEVETKEGKAKLGKGIQNYDSLIVLSHFTGHIAAGFGAALKNMGMGFGSRAGKLHMHSNITPFVNKSNCIGCQTCIQNCNANAIKLIDGKAEINKNKCEGCTMCIAVCPQQAIGLPWEDETKGVLQKRIVNYSEAVMNLFGKKIVFINVLENITKDCDCFGIIQEPIMEDIGILTGNDIVAIDKASLDLIKEKGKDLDGQVQIDYAAEKELGSKDYEIIDLDK